MSNDNSVLTTQGLIELNNRIADMEQKQGAEALDFFKTHLSHQLIFRRASGKVVGKSEPGGFLDSLGKPGPFESLRAQEIAVTPLGDRALVTLIVVGTRADGSVGRYRNVRLFSRSRNEWVIEFWYNYELTNAEEQLKGYEQLCTSYHAIDDFRSKLLGLLPIVSGSGIFLLLTEALAKTALKDVAARQFLYPIGLFGFVVALGLFCYELYGIRKCHALIEAGKRMERLLEIREGQFQARPRSLFNLINEPFAAGLIYSAVLAAWMFLALLFPQSQGNSEPAIVRATMVATRVFSFGFAFTLIYNLTLPYWQYARGFFRKLL
jgi:Domain of unknown function (DUF4440)